jgi:photosystem I subunit X
LNFLPVLALFADTSAWSPKVGAVMIIANIIAIAIGRLTIKYPNVGPQLPAPQFFGGLSLPALLATTSFGHILGAGAILGLSNMGIL